LAHDFTYIDDVVRTGCVASLDVVDKSTSSGGKKTGHVWLCIFNRGILVLQTLLPTMVDIVEKYLNLKSKREIVKMPCDGDIPFTAATTSVQLRVSCNTSHKQILKQGLQKFVKSYLSYYSDNIPHEPLVAQQP
jgi:UDP-glucuronate 4-epimerase